MARNQVPVPPPGAVELGGGRPVSVVAERKASTSKTPIAVGAVDSNSLPQQLRGVERRRFAADQELQLRRS